MIIKHTDTHSSSLEAMFLRRASEEDTSLHYYGVIINILFFIDLAVV